MTRRSTFRWTLTIALCAYAAYAAAQAPAHPEHLNLKVLPQDIPHGQLLNIMSGFTRALGVRCAYCHAIEEGQPHTPEQFAKDDKPAKIKARTMMRMTQAINDQYLSTLESRAQPPVRVQCVTCHHGIAVPRTLQEVLQASYDLGGIDSTLARYHTLRDRYYGRFTYDFGDVPLADVASSLRTAGHPEDAARLLAFNVEMNPDSPFARRQNAGAVIGAAFRTSEEAGKAAYADLTSKYGARVVNEELLTDVGYQLLGAQQTGPAVGVFRLNAAEHPTSSNAHDSLGEALAANNDRKGAIEEYRKSLELDPNNDNARKKLEELGAKPAKAKKPKKST
jgi:hypothetical protein